MKKRWARIPHPTRPTGDVHVVPIKDLREHVERLDCWCVPQLIRVPGTTALLVAHHALDGRELVEAHGIN